MREVKISGDCDEEERAAAEEDYRSPVTEFWSERGSTEKREQRLKKRDSEGFFLIRVRFGFFNITRPD
jgi:hypothetical protein